MLSAAGPLARPNCYKTQSILQGKVAPCQKLWQVECQLQCVQSCPAVWQTGLSWECWHVETLVSPSRLARPCTLADLLLKKCCAADKADLLGQWLEKSCSVGTCRFAILQPCHPVLQLFAIKFGSLWQTLPCQGIETWQVGRLQFCSLALQFGRPA